ncbi:MAG TPA: spore coat protein CotH [Clostridiaceae bacterium]|nr:spore coat protein CotH [Clostridiaceae bacterium]
MIKSNKINIIGAVAVAFALTTSAALVVFGKSLAKSGAFEAEPEYAAKIFGTDIISIEILADEDNWQEMLDNAINEQFIMVDVIVNGKKFKNVGIRPKGNSSLTQVANSNSDRYSFRLQFDEYIKGQTCFGLESFVLNNMLGDYTYMKEYISYDLMHEAGVDAPYFGFARIKVNGEDWGLYLAVELYNDSYEQRVYGDTSGMLYNVKSMDMGGNFQVQGRNVPVMPDIRNLPAMPGIQNIPVMPDGRNNPAMPGAQDFPDMQNGQNTQPMPERQNPPAMTDGQNSTDGQNLENMQDGRNFLSIPDRRNVPAVPNEKNVPTIPDGQNIPTMPDGQNPQFNIDNFRFFPQMDDGNRGMNRFFADRGGRGSSGGSLEYIDDNIESYSAIFNNVVGKGDEKDFQRVIKALKALSEGKDLEKYFDVDKILRYLAAHTIVVNLDSYSSIMAQNYYIYERDGRITILPWDYNLAWGGFQSGSASSVINFPIDTPVSGVEMSSRPLIDKLFANPEYLERYHSYLQQLIDNYFANGKFEEKIKELDALISDYVKNDPTEFYTYEEYEKAVSAFITLGNLRAQSIQGQLEGTIPSTTEGQRTNSDKLVSAGDLNLSVLGTMMGGRGGNNMNNMNFPGIMGGAMFGNIPDNIRQNTEPTAPDNNTGNSDRMRQNRRNDNIQNNNVQNNNTRNNNTQNSNTMNPLNTRFSSDQSLIISNFTLIVVLILVLIAAIIFAARFKKSY